MQDEMKVIAHQAQGGDSHAEAVGSLVQAPHELMAVSVVDEQRLVADRMVRDVMPPVDGILP